MSIHSGGYRARNGPTTAIQSVSKVWAFTDRVQAHRSQRWRIVGHRNRAGLDRSPPITLDSLIGGGERRLRRVTLITDNRRHRRWRAKPKPLLYGMSESAYRRRGRVGNCKRGSERLR